MDVIFTMYKSTRGLNFNLVLLLCTVVFYSRSCSPILFDRIEYSQNVPHQIDKRQTSNCTKTQFTCKSRDCIEQSKLCDGVKNCKDGSDETIQMCNKTCPTLKFRCNDGACVRMSAKCNGIKECWDGSDEYHCTGPKTSTTSKLTTKTASKPTTKTTLIPVPSSSAPPQNLYDDCEVPSYSKYKKVVVTDSSGKLLSISPGSRVGSYSEIEVTCNSEYSLLNGEKVQRAVCLRTKVWHPPLKLCKKTCPTLNVVNVELTCYREGQVINCNGNLVNGTRVRPMCKPLYRKEKEVNFSELRCQENGEWDNELFGCVLDCGIPSTSPESLIFKGTPVLMGDSPWNVAIYRISNNYSLICGGTLISENMVVSAAHCFYDSIKGIARDSNSDYEVVVSKYTNNYNNRDNGYQKTYQIRNFIYTDIPYKGLSDNNARDIVVLVLKKTVEISKYVLPACISTMKNFRPAEGTLGKLVGWGQEEEGDVESPTLFSAELPYISYHKCLQIWEEITPDKFCAGSDTGPGALNGDSGGGLMFRDPDNGHYFLRGVLSTGIIFTSISDCGLPSTSAQTLIFNGVKALVGNSPWHVAIYKISSNYTLICGGTLISDNMVVSAAHCFFDGGLRKVVNSTSDYEVVVSKYTRDYKTLDSNFQKTYQISKIIFTDVGFNPILTGNYGHDIVVLVLNQTVEKNIYVLPACIQWNTSATDGFQPVEGTPGKLVGWGVNKMEDVPNSFLLSAELPYISYRECIGKVEQITPDKFCAGNNTGIGVGPRKGDSGGGLMFHDPNSGRYFLRGIVSTRNTDREPNIATFTDISKHLDWLTKVRNEVESELIN